MEGIDQNVLDSLNVAQGRKENREYLDMIGGIDVLLKRIGVDVNTGLNTEQIAFSRTKLGDNTMPDSPKTGFLTLLLRALSDTTLLILIAAACVSFGIGKQNYSHLFISHIRIRIMILCNCIHICIASNCIYVLILVFDVLLCNASF